MRGFVKIAMNTIPIIFNERQIKRTVLGGTEKHINNSLNISVILLNTGGNHYRIPALESLTKCGFTSIISMENFGDNYSLDDCSKRFPQVKFIIPLEKVTVGDLINIGIGEVETDYVMILRDNIKISPNVFNLRLVEHLRETDILCTVPMLHNLEMQIIPVQTSPKIEKNGLKFVASSTFFDGCPTVFPFDCVGIYNRSKFIRLGGFDYTITSSYWQIMDFFLRAWLWGEKTLLTTYLRLYYEGMIPMEDTTIDASYLRFFLKNVAPKIKTDYAYIPINKFFGYASRKGGGLIECVQEFADARKWVEKNKYRFKMTVQDFVQTWEVKKE